ncbi:MAG: PIN domain-containing protein [Candidatus Electrothrix sp. AW3_4]|nr:PIN domain-containing protein [Candidatus Electrothrix gigas]
MKGIDTNILVRFLVGDDEQQAQNVYTIFKDAERNKEELFVPLPVVLELMWVLESVYAIKRKSIIEALRELLLMPILKFEHQSGLQQCLQTAEGTSFDLSDLLIAHAAQLLGCETVITFDKKAAKFHLFESAE